jgi:hypothetical protein
MGMQRYRGSAWILAFLMLAEVAHAQYYVPNGVQTNVPTSTVSSGGWSQCYQDLYNNGMSTSTVLTSCAQPYLMLSCRATGASTLDVLAWAARADVTYPVPDSSSVMTTHTANGVGWYYSSTWSWGFAPAGDSITHFTCDTTIGIDGALRLCWDTTGAAGGYRCATARSLNGSSVYERIVYQRSSVSQQLVLVGGDAQAATVSTPYRLPLTVRVTDEFNNSLSGKTVTFTAPATGASGAFGPSQTSIQVLSDVNGDANATITANSAAGSYMVIATIVYGASFVQRDFNLSNLDLNDRIFFDEFE